jgi:sulfite exporter TauE/SafE
MDLIVAFITGLTTGGLGCLAVQGGLLASTLANQVEKDMLSQSNTSSGRFRPHIAQPIFLFLLAKLIRYTILGFILGAIGSVVELSPMARAIMYIAIGVFMLGNGLRMFNVHPIFRYFVFEPPGFLTRYIRRKSKNNVSMVTPLFLGALTIFLPCGVTQAMMAVALGTGSPLQGAAIMFAFILGTSPIFFSVSYFATRLGSVVEKYFTRLVAITLLVLGVVQIDSGLNLAGAPFSFGNVLNSVSARMGPVNIGYTIHVTEDGYSPQVLHLPANKPVRLTWITEGTQSCARSVVVPDLDYQKILPPTGKVNFYIPAQEMGAVIRYTCSMGMYPSQLIFDLE